MNTPDNTAGARFYQLVESGDTEAALQLAEAEAGRDRGTGTNATPESEEGPMEKAYEEAGAKRWEARAETLRGVVSATTSGHRLETRDPRSEEERRKQTIETLRLPRSRMIAEQEKTCREAIGRGELWRALEAARRVFHKCVQPMQALTQYEQEDEPDEAWSGVKELVGTLQSERRGRLIYAAVENDWPGKVAIAQARVETLEAVARATQQGLLQAA